MTSLDIAMQRKRLMPLKNTSAEEMPGYGLGCLTPTEPSSPDFSLYSQVAGGDGNSVWTVERPGETAATNLIEYLQDPGLLVANASPVPIPPGGFGWGTQDWPIRVLHDPADGRMGVGSICGPKIGTWYVSSAGSAFTVVSHDASETGDGLGGAAEPAKLHRIYVTRARQGLPQDMASLQAGDTGLDDDEKLIWTSAEATDKLAAVRMAGFTLLTDSSWGVWLGNSGLADSSAPRSR